MITNLGLITNEGFKDTGTTFAEMRIYSKEDQRIMYRPKDDVIYMKYKVTYQDGKVKTLINLPFKNEPKPYNPHETRVMF